MTIGDRAIEAVERHPAVLRISLVGSRAAGTSTSLSDWDFAVETDNFRAVARDIESLLSPLHPLAQQWDPLSKRWCWMAILPGPVKLDFIFDEPHKTEAPWHPSAGNIDAIDRHFWDWTLWLASKQLGGTPELVRSELHKLWIHILSPMGLASAPVSLTEAVTNYIAARGRLERQFHASVPRALEREVLPIIR